MTTLRFAPLDDTEADLLALVGDPHTVTRKPLADAFRAACWAEALAHDGWVDPNAVRARVLAEVDDPNMRQYSALWAPAAGPDGYLDVVTTRDVPIDGKGSRGNSNKKVLMRRWRDWAGGSA